MSILDSVIGIIAPHSCLVCGREGGLVCVWCAHDAFPLLPSRCYRCNAQTEDSSVCQKCHRVSPLKHVWVRTNYDGLAKLLIHKYKFLHARAGAADIAQQISQALPYFVDTILVPIPTATNRVRQRGFDHAQLLARQLGQILKLENKTLLRRFGQSRQVGTRRSQRTKQVVGTFQAVGHIKDKKILIVDDVTTSGATLEEAARVLKRAGARQVDAVVFAQVK